MMWRSTNRPVRLAALMLGLVLVAAACGDDDGGGTAADTASETTAAPATEAPGDDSATESTTTVAVAGPVDLVGLFALDAGACAADGTVTGSYFRMVQPGGTLAEGPYLENGDSTCADTTYSTLTPGSDGGLVTGTYQPLPDPPFDADGNATVTSILAPTPFFAVGFGVATNDVDPQTGAEVSAPSLVADEGVVSGDLSAFAAAWNGQHFNQGAPKPDGSNPGLTAGPSGTYDAETGAFVLEWSSQVIEGPFNEFTGVWHLEGTFEAS